MNSLVDDYLHTLTSHSNPDLAVINAFYETLIDKASSFTRIVELLIQYGHRHLLVDLSLFDVPDDIASAICDEVVLAASIEGVTINEENSLFDSTDSSIYLLYQFLAGNDIEIDQLKEIECPVEYEHTRHFPFYEHFFRNLIVNLIISTEFNAPELTAPTDIQGFLNNAWATFQYAPQKLQKI